MDLEIHDFYEPIDAANLEMTLNLEATLFPLLSLLTLSALLELRTLLALFWEPHDRHDRSELHDRDRRRGRDDDRFDESRDRSEGWELFKLFVFFLFLPRCFNRPNKLVFGWCCCCWSC